MLEKNLWQMVLLALTVLTHSLAGQVIDSQSGTCELQATSLVVRYHDTFLDDCYECLPTDAPCGDSIAFANKTEGIHSCCMDTATYGTPVYFTKSDCCEYKVSLGFAPVDEDTLFPNAARKHPAQTPVGPLYGDCPGGSLNTCICNIPAPSQRRVAVRRVQQLLMTISGALILNNTPYEIASFEHSCRIHLKSTDYEEHVATLEGFDVTCRDLPDYLNHASAPTPLLRSIPCNYVLEEGSEDPNLSSITLEVTQLYSL